MNDATPVKGTTTATDAPVAKAEKPVVKSFLDKSIKLENLVPKRTIGTGTFGRVKLVQDKFVRGWGQSEDVN